MDQLHINYSLKNIPIPARAQYKKQLVSKVANFASRLRWKMLFIRQPSTNKNKQTFGFRTTSSPPQMIELKAFEDELFSLLSNIKFRQFNNQLQDKLREDKKKISKTEEIIVQADKSPNLYKMSVTEYKKQVKNNITKDYRLCPRSDLDQVTREAAEIARELDVADRIDIPTEDEAFISVKDHKDSFPSRVECRLINPAKNNIGVISKSILDKINTAVREATNSNQWLNTSSAIDWFNSITTKSNYTFFKFDIVSFYPSIKRKLLTDAIQWARIFTNISVQEVNVIMHCRKMF